MINISDGTLHIITAVLGCMVLLEQVLAEVPALKSNSTLQLIVNITNGIVKMAKQLLGITLPPPAPCPPTDAKGE